VLWALTFLNVAAGMAFSPITGANQVRVIGAKEFDKQRITRILGSLKDVPCVRVNGYSLEGAVLDLSEARSAELSRNIFQRAVLEVEYREPVARIFGQPGLALSSEGVLFRSQRLLKEYPLLKTPDRTQTPALAFCSPLTGKSLAHVCDNVRRLDQLQAVTVEVDSKGSVYLHNGFGTRVVIGPPERMDEKLTKLAEILRSRPEILRQAKELNLISPSRAVIVPRTQGVAP
jgi:cell division septal protein FtsQ